MPEPTDAEMAAYMATLPIAELKALAAGAPDAMARAIADLMPRPLLEPSDGRTVLGLRPEPRLPPGEPLQQRMACLP